MVYITLGASLFFLACEQKEFETASPAFRNVTEYVYTNGSIFPDDLQEINASQAAVINKVYTTEQDSVKSGTPIVCITATAPASQNEYVKSFLDKIRTPGIPIPDLGISMNTAPSPSKDVGKTSVLRANSDGKIYFLGKKKGDMVKPGETIAIIGNSNKAIAILEVNEEDIQKINVGYHTVLKINAFGDSLFTGKVTRIFPKMNPDRKTFQVQVLMYPMSVKYIDMSVDANILVSEKRKTLSIPANFIEKGDSIWVKKGRNFIKILIKTGFRDSQFTEIIDHSITDKTIIGRKKSSSFKF